MKNDHRRRLKIIKILELNYEVQFNVLKSLILTRPTQYMKLAQAKLLKLGQVNHAKIYQKLDVQQTYHIYNENKNYGISSVREIIMTEYAVAKQQQQNIV